MSESLTAGPSVTSVHLIRLDPARYLAVATIAGLGGLVLAVIGVRFGTPVLAGTAVAAVVAGAVASDRSLAVGAFFLALPLGLTALGPVQLVELSAVAVVGVVAASRLSTGVLPLPSAHVCLWLTFVLLSAAVATPLSVSPALTFRADVLLLAGVLVAVVVGASVDGLEQVRRLVAMLVLSGAVIAAFGILSTGTQEASFGGAVIGGRAQGIFAQPNELGVFTAGLLVLALGLWLGTRTRVTQVASLACCALLAWALLLTQSRGAWIGACVGLVALYFIAAGARRRMRRLLAFLLAVAGAITLVGGTLRLPSVLASRLASITDPSQNPYDGRPDIYAEAFRLVNEAPVLGHGPGAFSVAAWEGLSTGRVLQAEHAHNLWLTIATEYGLLGLVSFLGLSMAVGWAGLSGTRALLRNGRPTDAAVCAGALAALVALLGHGLVDYPLRNPVLFLTYWAIAGLVLAFARFAATSVAGDPGSMSRRE